MWPDSEQTQQLLAAAGNGEVTAVNNLMDRHREAVRKMVNMRLDRQ